MVYERLAERPAVVQPTPAPGGAAKKPLRDGSAVGDHSLRRLTDGNEREEPIQRVLVSFASVYAGDQKATIDKGEASYRAADANAYRSGTIADVAAGETLYLYAHGSPDSYAKMTAEQLALYLVNNNLPVTCKHIHLLGCATDMANNSYAGKLKDALAEPMIVGASKVRFVESITGSPAKAFTKGGVQYTKDLVKNERVPVPIVNNQTQILAEFDPLSSFQKDLTKK